MRRRPSISNASSLITLCLIALVATCAQARDHRVEVLDQPAPTDEISSDIAAQLAPTGYRIVRGEDTTLCHIWFVKQFSAKSGFSASASILYPFNVGDLMGVVQYVRKAGDFRAQDIEEGVYTLRYAQQPVDGNHLGTSDTRDFLLLLGADEDEDAESIPEEDLWAISAESIDSTHPGMLSMLVAEESDDLPQMIEDSDRDLWSLLCAHPSGDDGEPLTIQFVLVGEAEE